MRVIIIIVVLFLAIITILDILASKIDRYCLIENAKLEKQNERLKQTIKIIRNDLFLATSKECSDEERINIIKENVEFIDEIEKVW